MPADAGHAAVPGEFVVGVIGWVVDSFFPRVYRSLPSHPQPHNPSHQESKARAKVISFCKAVDAVLGGGVHKGQITELSGLPGTGKTQIAYVLYILDWVVHGSMECHRKWTTPPLFRFGFVGSSCEALLSFIHSFRPHPPHRMQLAVDARIPKSFRGAGQEAVYIGT